MIMKKLILTIAIILGMTFGASAQPNDGNGLFGGKGLFGEGTSCGDRTDPDGHGEAGNAPVEPTPPTPPVPLGSGALLLIGMGAAYAVAKKDRK